MKARQWVETFQRFDPEEEVHIEGVVRETDIMKEAEFQGITCTCLDAQFILRKMEDRNDDTDTLIEYYLDLYEKGELSDE